MTTLADSNKPFLDYLDKEMTIQGILSAFCVAAAGVVFDRILGPRDASPFILHLQQVAHIFVLAAGAGLLLAAVFFYLQRSGLAWHLIGFIELRPENGGILAHRDLDHKDSEP